MELDKKILEQFLEFLSINHDKYDLSEMPNSVKIALLNAFALEGNLVPEEKEIVEEVFSRVNGGRIPGPKPSIYFDYRLGQIGNFIRGKGVTDRGGYIDVVHKENAEFPNSLLDDLV